MPYQQLKRALVVVAVAAAAGCKRKESGPNGVGPWQFGKSKLADAEAAGRCLPGDPPIQCIGLSAVQIGKQVAATELYFASGESSAPLLEISLTVRTCDVAEAGSALEGVIGPVTEQSKDGRLKFWAMKEMFVVAQLPAKGTRECLVNFVEPKDTARIEELKKGE